MKYQIVVTAGSDTAILHDAIVGYSVASGLFQGITNNAKARGRLVRYDFDTLKGNQKPIAMRAIVSADRPNGASYTIDLIMLK